MGKFDLRKTVSVLSVLMPLSVVTTLSMTENADAQSRAQICRGLTKKLNAIGNTSVSGGNSKKYRQFDSAVRKQSNQISKAKRALKRNGCVGLLKNSRSQCRAINNSLKKMQANLASLKSQRAKFAPKRANNSAKRDRILASLRRNRCSSTNGRETRQANADTRPKSRRRTILEQVFGVRAYDNNGNRNASASVEADARFASRYGTFRTLCVRKTDGYYFPISFSTVQDRFEEDSRACQSMCPGSEVDLYYHRMPNEDSEDMISYGTNTPYRDEPFAFAYRQTHNPENKCRFSTAGLTQNVDTFVDGEIASAEKTVRIGVPVFRKDQSLSPNAYDIAVEGLNIARIKQYYASVKENNEVGSEQIVAQSRNVRIVGPAFFPVQ